MRCCSNAAKPAERMLSSIFIKGVGLFLVGFILILPDPIFGRFSHLDAIQIDCDEILDLEYYNAIISYRFSPNWISSWHQSENGLRLNSGSININRSLYEEDIKLKASYKDSVYFEFLKKHHEDLIETRSSKEFKIGFNLIAPVQFFIAADGGTYKKWSDTGISVRYVDKQQRAYRISYWSVDHYYNSKEELPYDRYKKRPRSISFDFNGKFDDALLWTLFYEHDYPTQWQRVSKGYSYEYSRKSFKAKIAVLINSNYTFNIDADIERKNESKRWEFSDNSLSKKSLDRKVKKIEANIVYNDAKNDELLLGTQFIRREARYEHQIESILEEDTIEEPISPNSSRDETCVFSLYTHSISSSEHHFFEWGLFFNIAKIKESLSANLRQDNHDFSKVMAGNELRLKWAYALRISRGTRFLFSTYWDLDQVQRDYPYNGDIGIFGGANIQMQMVF